MIKSFAAPFALVVSCVLPLATVSVPASAKILQCVPFARQVSGIEIHGNAKTWWAQAAGKYDRAGTPLVGSVMSFKAIRSMPYGHVAMVSRLVSDREVLLTHANWSRRGGIERDVRAVDVSAAGDWSAVRVWFAGSGGLGTTVYPLNGFIRPGKGAPSAVEPAIVPAAEPLPTPGFTIATAAAVPVDAALVR
jgi:surface antigen